MARMRGRRRSVPITLPTIHHDRKSTDLPHGAIVAPVLADDPYEPGTKIEVMRSLRDDPLAHLHSLGVIDNAELMAGRRWQRNYDRAGIGGVRAIDTTKEPVDGRRFVDPVTDVQRLAMAFLAMVASVLGQEGDALIRDVLGKGWSLAQCAASRGLNDRERSRDMRYLGRRFRECLDTMAKELGYADRRS